MRTVSLVATVVVVIGIIIFVLQEEHVVDHLVVKLGDPLYDILPIESPAASGSLLKLIVQICETRLGVSVRRFLLKQNRLDRIRDLASQLTIPPIHFPVRRLSLQEREDNERNDCEEGDPLCLQRVIQSAQQEVGGSSLRTSIDFHNAYLGKTTTPTKVVERLLSTVAAWEQQGQIIFTSIQREQLLSESAASTARYASNSPLSVLDGVPVAFKDMVCITGHRVHDGRSPQHPDLQSHLCTEDDPIVANFRRYGALIVGLTIMTEGGVTPLGYNSHWRGPFSAFSMYRYSGGSSSGSAVSVASGLTPIAIGFDNGGSVRLPATMSGLHGLATTFGRVAFGLKDCSHWGSSLIKSGPIAASSVDAAIGYAVLADTARHHPDHFYHKVYDGGVLGTPRGHVSGWEQTDSESLRGLRIGIFRPWAEDCTSAIRDRFHTVVHWLESQGVEVVEINIPHLSTLAFAHALKIATEYARDFDADMARKDNVLEYSTRMTASIGMTPTALEQLSGDVLRHWAYTHILSLFQNHSLSAIVTPTIPVEVPVFHSQARELGESNNALSVQLMRYMSLVNFLGLPAYTVPVGYISPETWSGEETPEERQSLQLPVGFQFIGNHWTEHVLLRLGHVVEKGLVKEQQWTRQQKKPLFSVDLLQ